MNLRREIVKTEVLVDKSGISLQEILEALKLHCNNTPCGNCPYDTANKNHCVFRLADSHTTPHAWEDGSIARFCVSLGEFAKNL